MKHSKAFLFSEATWGLEKGAKILVLIITVILNEQLSGDKDLVTL